MRAFIASLVVVVVSAGCGPRNLAPIAPPAGWKLAWADEFDGAAGTSPDPASWNLETGTGANGDGWGNNELQTYTDRPENASLDGEGHLVLTARREAMNGRQYTSARLTTQGKVTPKYGRVEARMKLPRAKGLWPAFWMLGASITTEGWPTCGEIDVLEMRGDAANIAIGSLHGPEYFGGGAISKKYTLPGATFDQDFHLFAVEWDPGQVTFWVDDQLFQTVTAHTVLGTNRTWVYDAPFFLLLNLAVGGNFLGASGQPDANTVFPQAMTIDWVRTYERVQAQ